MKSLLILFLFLPLSHFAQFSSFTLTGTAKVSIQNSNLTLIDTAKISKYTTKDITKHTTNFYSTSGQLYVANRNAHSIYVHGDNYEFKTGEVYRVYEFNNKRWMINKEGKKFSIITVDSLVKYEAQLQPPKSDDPMVFNDHIRYEQVYGPYIWKDDFEYNFWKKNDLFKLKKSMARLYLK